MLASRKLPDKYVNAVYDLFQKKGWTLEGKEPYSFFDRFCERMAELEKDDDRDFMLELTQGYLWVSASQYEQLLEQALQKVISAMTPQFEKAETIYICPLLAKQDFGKIKSSVFMAYMCQDIILRQYALFHRKQIRICESPQVLEEHRDTSDPILLIDDFIGSGETALGCLTFLQSIQIESSRLAVVVLVAQQGGEQIISEQGIPVYASKIRDRGISDHYAAEQKGQRLSQMRRISHWIKAPKWSALGFGDTEALVSMIRTPNNTFPFYWYERENKSLAPFPRRGNIKMIAKKGGVAAHE